MTDLVVKPLTPDLVESFLAFFDGPAFADNPEWGGCYCRFCFVRHGEEPWDDQDGPANRADTEKRIREGRMGGYLAYADGEVVGWLNAGHGRLYPPANIGGPDPDGDRMGHAMCFVVSPGWRGKGVARTLLEGALQDLKRRGVEIVQANPRADAQGSGANFHGPLALYEAAGFVHHRTDDEDGSLFVRRRL